MQMPSPFITPPQGISRGQSASMPQAPDSSGAGMGPQMGILQKITQGMAPQKQKPIPESQSVNLLVTAIKALNQYADILTPSDEMNARTVRTIIKVLGEVLRSAEHQQPTSADTMPQLT